jgi:hypothetical protein
MKGKSYIKAVALIFAIVILNVNTALSQNNKNISENPRKVIEHFLKLDTDGARLGTDTYKASGIGDYVVQGEYESPGWDTVTLITDYKIQKITQSGSTASAMVKYNVIGKASNNLEIKKKNEIYIFKLKKQNHRWFIVEPYDLPQHISVDAAIKHWELLDKLQGDIDPDTKTMLRKLKTLKAGLTNKSRRR